MNKPLISRRASWASLAAAGALGILPMASAAPLPMLTGLIVTSDAAAGPGAVPEPRRICGTPIVTASGAPSAPPTGAARAALLAQDPVAVQLPAGLLDADALQRAARRQIGQPIDNTLTQALIADTVGLLNARSRYLADVYFPPQRSDDGVLVLVVRAARLGRVVANGQRHHTAEDIECRVRLQSGEPLDAQAVAADVTFLNQASPWRRTDLSFQPGQQPGTTDVVLTTADEAPRRWYAGADNTGTAVTGRGRFRAGVDWGNAFGRFDHQLGYSLTTASEPRRANAHSLSYSLPTPGRDRLAFHGAYSRSSVPLQDGVFESRGSNIEAGARWSRSLGAEPARAGRVGEVFAGLEYKRIGNALLFGQTPVSDSVPEVLQFTVGGRGGFADGLGRSEFDARLTLSPGGLFGGNDDAHFDAARAGASSRYGRFNASFDKFIVLPRQWQVRAHVHGQYANRALISSERFAVSGSTGVRGYHEETLTADAGVVGTLELQSPYWPLAIGERQAVWQVLGFVDGGRSWSATPEQHTDLGRSDTRFSLAAHGLGVRFNLNPTLTLRLDAARRHTGLPDAAGVLWHGSLLVAY